MPSGAGPKARGIGCKDLVGEDKAITDEAEFKLGVGEDDAARFGVGGGFGVDGEGQVAQAVGEVGAEAGGNKIEGNVLVVPAFGFVGGRVDGLGQTRAILQAGRQRDAADGARALVILPAGADEVAAGHAFHVDHAGFVDEHDASAQGVAIGGREAGDIGDVGADEVIGDQVAEEIKPEERHLRQHDAFAGDAGGEHAVEGGDPVSGDDEETVVADGIDVADFAAFGRGPAGEIGFEQLSFYDEELTPPTAEIVPGLWRISLPLPFDLRQVHVHLVRLPDGWMLVDTGLDSDACREALAAGLAAMGIAMDEIRVILLTHTHPDHVGNGIRYQRESGARLLLHRDEQDLLERIEARPDEVIDTLLEAAGAPAAHAGPTRESFLVLRKSFRVQPADTLLTGGEEMGTALGVMRTIVTPGHAVGHLCLHLPEAGVLIAGDHVLPVITPIINWSPEGDNLRCYLDSLDVIDGCEGALVLPSHGERIEGLTARTQEIRRHHVNRCEAVEMALTESERTAHEIVPFLWKRALSAFNYRFALDEVLAHLEYLRRMGRVEARTVNGALRWRRATVPER